MMPLGAFRINGLAKFTVTAVAEVIRRKIGVTAFGNAQVDTAQSKFGGASALFDGSGDYLRSYALPALGTNDFTIEFWARFNSTSNSFLLDARTSANGNFPTISYFSGLFYYVNGNNRITGSSLSTGVWYHIAVSRSGTSTKMFVDGTQVGSTYSDSTNYTATDYWTIAANGTDGGTAFNGHIDEIRVSKTARYTANFTAPTASFVNDENTLLLIHCNGTDAATVFEDDNGVRSKIGVTAQNSAQVDTAQSKFGGAAALFDGTTDLLITESTSAFAFGTTQYTIEGWLRLNSTGKQHTFFDIRAAGNDWVLYVNSSNRLEIFTGSTGTGSTTLSSAVWYHIAVVRDSTNLKVYLNGTQEIAITAPNISGSRQLRIGGGRDGGSFPNTDLNGWMDEVRVSNTARYTASFTAPTTVFTNDANTLLLLHMDGTDASTYFEDDNGSRAKLGITAIGNAQVDTAQSKFGGASALFDGTGDYLQIDNSSLDFTFGNNDFTIEMQIRLSQITDFRILWDGRQTSQFTQISPVIYVELSSGNPVLKYYVGSDKIVSNIVTNTWYHIAVSRSGSNTRMFVNGTQVGSTYTTLDNLVANTTVWLGGHRAVGGSNIYSWNGHIDEVRVSNTARYTANFTAPTASFQNDANTLLLLHMDGTDASIVFTDDNGVTPTHNYS
jgi:hypothetical protein